MRPLQGRSSRRPGTLIFDVAQKRTCWSEPCHLMWTAAVGPPERKGGGADRGWSCKCSAMFLLRLPLLESQVRGFIPATAWCTLIRLKFLWGANVDWLIGVAGTVYMHVITFWPSVLIRLQEINLYAAFVLLYIFTSSKNFGHTCFVSIIPSLCTVGT